MSATVLSKNFSLHFSIALLMSPSVMSPAMVFSSVMATPSPSFPLLTSIMASPRCISGVMTGIISVIITSWAVVSSRFPSSPPGWNWAKSCGLKLRFSISATAMASPMARVAVVLLVGARLRGHASLSTLTLMWHEEYFASRELGLPLMPIMGISICSTMGMKRSSSSVCPELDIANTTSSRVITPRSP